MKLTPERMRDLLTEAQVFQSYLSEVADVNAATRETDPKKRRELREKYVSRKALGFPSGLDNHEIDMLFEMASGVLQHILAKRMAAFRIEYGIEIEGIPMLEGQTHG